MPVKTLGMGGGPAFAESYELLELLGEGGFGSVHRARQRATGQSVAVKIMRHSCHGDQARKDHRAERFLQEMHICAKLHHPNIVPLIDAGQTLAGELYSVFAFVPGENLAELLTREGALSERETWHLMSQVLDALTCAHAAGVVHRDLKPRNIMVISTGARRNAALLDFGIGAMPAEADPTALRLTGIAEILGTPGYAAPEQLRGLDATMSADLFSWGLIFLECLSGRPVYTGDTLAEVLHAQLGAHPVPIPADLDALPLGALLREATRKEPAARRLDARGLLAALERCEPTTAINWATVDPARTERRHVTAVYCCLNALASPTGPLDVEERDDRLSAHLEVCHEVARKHRGHLVAAFGDRALFYFGYPCAAEDDARRAARAALAIAAEGEATVASFGHELRIGIHTGIVMARPGVCLGAGITSRTASEVVAFAPPGGIAVSPETRRLLQSTFHFAGHDEPGVVSRLLGEIDLHAPVRTPGARSTSIVGRDQELALLRERWGRARRGAGQCTLITGEPGIGKSRLVRELQESLGHEPHVLLECRCAPDAQDNALYPIVELLRRLSERESATGADGAGLAALLSRHGLAPHEHMPLFAPLLGVPLAEDVPLLDITPQRRKARTLQALVSLLLAMAVNHPVFLLFEDLHWADPTTVELLALFVHETAAAPVYAIFTARPEISPNFPTTRISQLHLSRLEAPQIRAMLGELVGGKPLPEGLIAQVVHRTDGVPLFVEELVWMLLDSGVVALRDGRYELLRPLVEVAIPATLRDLLTERLDRLGAALGSAQIAAALGREFNLGLLRAVSSRDTAAVQDDLERLLAAGLVHRKRRVGEQIYVFRHALIRDAAYESMTRADRRCLHRAIAQALEAGADVRLGERPEVLASHYTAADMAEQAIPLWLAAGQHALAQSANPEAIAHLERALELLAMRPDTPARAGQELGLRLALSVALTASQGYAAPLVGDTYERARVLCDQLGDSRQLFPVIWGLGAFHAVRAQLDTALTLGERAQAIAEREQDAALLVPAHLVHGGCYLWRGALTTARAHFERGLFHYDPESHGPLATLYSYDPGTANLVYLALTMCYLGFADQARQLARSAVDQTRTAGHMHSYVHSLTRAAQVAVLLGDGLPALDGIEALITISEDRGFPMWRAAGVYLRGRALCQAGQARRGISDIRAGLHSIAETGTQVIYPEYLGGLAEALGDLGEFDAGLERVTEALEVATATGACLHEADLRRIRGELLWRRDAGPAAEEMAEQSLLRALEVARRDRAKLWELRAAHSLARLWRHQGRASAARVLLLSVYTSFDEGLQTHHLRAAQAELEAM